MNIKIKQSHFTLLCIRKNLVFQVLFRLFTGAVLVVGGDSDASRTNPLEGRHLEVVAVEFIPTIVTVRNSTGHVINANGMLPQMVEGLSQMFHFSYSYIPYRAWAFDDLPQGRGVAYYILNNKADYAISHTIATAARSRIIDFPASHYAGRFGTIVPYPEVKTNIVATVKPLSYQVWIAICVAILAAIGCLSFLQWQLEKRVQHNKNRTSSLVARKGILKIRFAQYVWGNLVSQGIFLSSKRLNIRIVAGAWCCTCFFLVQIYCSTLTSHLTSPNQKPIVNSFFDVATTPGVSLTVEMGQGLDVLLKNEQSENMKQLVNMMNKNPSLRCAGPEACIAKVKEGSSVFSSNMETLKTSMNHELEKSNRTCSVTMLKETFWPTPVFSVLPKRSPYTKQFNVGILRMKDTGILDFWYTWYVPAPKKCMEINKKQNKALPRLSFAHLSSAFFILGVGYSAALVAFAFEKISFLVKLKKESRNSP